MRGRICSLAALSLILSSLIAPAARAAVRKCAATVSSDIVAAPTELAAKKKAIEQWREKALGQGAGFDSWRLAHLKALKCFPKDGGFECVAFGQPCIIDQTPRSPPKQKGESGTGI